MARISDLKSPSIREPYCLLCLRENRIAQYDSILWHRLIRRHWPRVAEANTADEFLYDGVKSAKSAKKQRRQEEWKSSWDRILFFLPTTKR